MLIERDAIVSCNEESLKATAEKWLKERGFSDDFINLEIEKIVDIQKRLKESNPEKCHLSFSEYGLIKNIEIMLKFSDCCKKRKTIKEKLLSIFIK